MKIYIQTDLEGISGIDCIDMIQRDDPRLRYSNERLMADINAAIDGAFAGGATQVTVLDSHASANNFIPELLDKRAVVDSRSEEKRRGNLDSSYAATLLIGAHAMAGTINGFLDHTQSSLSWYNYYINGCKCGEIAQWAVFAAHFGVPLIMVSGDEAACYEARTFVNPIETAAVKRGIGRNRAECLELIEAEDLIRQAAKRSISLIGKTGLYKPLLPMELKLELYRSDYCENYLKKPGVERIDARTVRKVSQSYEDVLF